MAGHIGSPELSRRFRPGLSQAMRRGSVPAAIAAGCDMFLFIRSPEEDFAFTMGGYRDGVISAERLTDALRRILALIASLGLHVKDRTSLVPAATHKKIRLYGIFGGSDLTMADPLGCLDTVALELESVGCEVHIFNTGDQRKAAGEEGVKFVSVICDGATAEYAENHDAALRVANVKGFAREAAIHAHADSVEAVRATVAKIQVPSEFQGAFNENVFCTCFDTRLREPFLPVALHARRRCQPW